MRATGGSIDSFWTILEVAVGIDFISAKRRFVKKVFNGGRAALETADLLVVEEVAEDLSVVFEIHEGVTLVEGEQLVVQVAAGTLVALRDGVVATALNPPESVMTAMRRAHGVALGRVVRVSAMSRTANIAFRLER
jgi:hypothetical protein